jgi:hypothetical protein
LKQGQPPFAGSARKFGRKIAPIHPQIPPRRPFSKPSFRTDPKGNGDLKGRLPCGFG